MTQFSIVGQFNISRSKEWQNQDTINMYGIMDDDAKTPQCLAPLPGITHNVDIDLGTDSIRTNGLYDYNNVIYIITGNKFYRRSNETTYFIGTITSDDGYISWTNNTTQICFADGIGFWVYTIATGVFAQVTTFALDMVPGPFPANPLACYFQDARIVVCFGGISEFYYSGGTNNTGDATQFSSSGFIAIESQSDTGAGISGSNERLFLFGNFNTEIWAPNTAGGQSPYYRDNSYIFEFGLASRASVVKGIIEYDSQNTPVINFTAWLTRHKKGVGSFVYSTGGIPQKLSTASVDLELSRMKNVSDCYGVIYKESGHTFIEYNFPTDNITLVVDMNTGWWVHKRRLDLSYSQINSHVYVNGIHYIGSRLQSSLYELSEDLLTDNGEEIVKTRISETLIMPNFERISGYKFEVDCEAGQVDNNITPYIFIYFSINGGRNWSNPFKIQMGKSGEYQWKTYIEGLGDGYAYTFKLEVYDPVRVYIFGANFEYEVSS